MAEKISDLWETPWDFFNELDKEFKFTLDVCASAENSKCDDFYTVAEDGLRQSWRTTPGTVWCNPPYSASKNWVEKAFHESAAGQRVVMLLNVATDTAYWHKFIFPYAEIRFLRGRLKFRAPSVRSHIKDAPRYANAVVVFHPESNEQFSADRVLNERFSTFVNDFLPRCHK